MVSRRDFERIADIIKSNSKGNPNGSILVKKHLIQDLIDYFSEENNAFDPDKFMVACSGKNVSYLKLSGDFHG
jgi:hypothetical protein